MLVGNWLERLIFKIMLPTRAGSTLSIFSPFHVDANSTCSCLDRCMDLSEFALSLVTCAQLSSKARNAHTHIVASYPLFCELIVFKIMLPTRAGSTFSIFSPFHVGANARCSCLGRYMGLSVRALIATCAFQNSHSRS